MICVNCGNVGLISKNLKVCLNCIRNEYDKVKAIIEDVHYQERKKFDLPCVPPKASNGVNCKICVNECQIPENEKGYCGLRKNEAGKLIHICGTKDSAVVDWYYDFLPTNCVAEWVCAASDECDEYSYSKGIEYGYKNLAVFYEACSFDCLFCQNWHYRYGIKNLQFYSAYELAHAVDETTACICYFGGDPSPQIAHALNASKLAKEIAKDRILRICWESNGSLNPNLLKSVAKISLESGGCIKFDLKAWNDNLHRALTGSSNKRTLENFKYLSEIGKKRPSPPFLIASTLLIPGYIDEEEIANIANFIASLDTNIPYSLLAFYPHFYMDDLPTTSKTQALTAYNIAKSKGLKRVKIGNIHLLS
jgi:pyruvate formate lyase activating enzyme